MARRGLRKNPTLETDVEKLIATLRRTHAEELEAALLDHDYPALLELRGQARIQKLTDLHEELRDVQEAARRRRRDEGAQDAPKLGTEEKHTAEAQRRYRKEAIKAAERPRRRSTRRGAGPGTQTTESTENILIRKGYRGYSYELEEITPNRWEVALTYEPIDVLEGQPSVKDAEFEIFNDPDIASRRVKREIDKVLSWFDQQGIQPRRTKRKGAKKKKKTSRGVSRVVGTRVVPSGREARRLAEQEAIDAGIRSGRSTRAERVQSYENLGYDPRADKKTNLKRMGVRIEELRTEMRVTRDAGARKDMADDIDVIKSMVRRVRAGKEPFDKGRRGEPTKRLSASEMDMAESYGALTTKKNPGAKPKKVRTLAAFRKLPQGTVVTIQGYTGRVVGGPRRRGQGTIGFYATGSDMYESNEKAGYDPLMSSARYYFDEDLEQLIEHGTEGDAWLGNPKKKNPKSIKPRKRRGYTIKVEGFGNEYGYEAFHPEQAALSMFGYSSPSKAFGAANQAIDKAVGLRLTRAFFDNPKKKSKKGRKLPVGIPEGTKITRVPPGIADLDPEFMTVKGHGYPTRRGLGMTAINPKKRIRRLTKKERDALPAAAFGLPTKRAYPMPNIVHARIAIIDAEVALRKEDITKTEYNKVIRKATAIMEAAIAAALAPNPRSLPHKRSKNPKPFWEGVFGGSDAKDAARKWERDAETELGRWDRSKRRKSRDVGALLNAYDALEMARSNYYLADDARRSGDMSDAKNKLREQVLDAMTPREVIIPEVINNPTAREHLKTGKDYLKRSERYWERYYKKGKANDLIDAYKYMVLAHDELKYGGDRRALAQVKGGLKAAQAELKIGLKSGLSRR